MAGSVGVCQKSCRRFLQGVMFYENVLCFGLGSTNKTDNHWLIFPKGSFLTAFLTAKLMNNKKEYKMALATCMDHVDSLGLAILLLWLYLSNE